MAKVVFENVYKSFKKQVQEESNRNIEHKSEILDSDSSSLTNQAVNVLRNINLEVKDGEFMVLVGPSGCGKSTLLRLLAGLEELTGGNVYIGDRIVNKIPPKARDIAMVFQNYALYPHLNVYDNIAFGLRRSEIGETESNLVSDWLEPALVGLTRSLPRSMRYISSREREIRKRVRYVASLLQIESLLSRLPKELSGGQKQRVALGRAIARNPQVFLMDEPLSNLDAKLRTETRAQIVQLQKQLGITTIYVTHDQTEAMTMGDRIAVMKGGEIQQIASPLEIYNQPANRFVAEFIGSPPMNFLPVELTKPLTLINPHFRLTLPEYWGEILHNQRNNKFLLGIRPQYFFLSPESSHISVKVNLVEALGSETYIKGTLSNDSDTSITASLSPDTIVSLGESINLSINLDKIHLFDANTQVGWAMPILR
ncbi:MAG: ABC transporter ATP-binding protein [Xenococcaceae cyanobacterium MO_207.B15]|nr:ABC transporter ATP-binding protein [Xenococcaceae cyanobacterium MO_207.B15]